MQKIIFLTLLVCLYTPTIHTMDRIDRTKSNQKVLHEDLLRTTISPKNNGSLIRQKKVEKKQRDRQRRQDRSNKYINPNDQ